MVLFQAPLICRRSSLLSPAIYSLQHSAYSYQRRALNSANRSFEYALAQHLCRMLLSSVLSDVPAIPFRGSFTIDGSPVPFFKADLQLLRQSAFTHCLRPAISFIQGMTDSSAIPAAPARGCQAAQKSALPV